MLALLHDVHHRHSVVWQNNVIQIWRLVWWRKCENGAGNRIWEVRHWTVVRGCQCFLTRWHEICECSWFFCDYCSSAGCIISGEKLLFRQLFMMWSASMCWQCCKNVICPSLPIWKQGMRPSFHCLFIAAFE